MIAARRRLVSHSNRLFSTKVDWTARREKAVARGVAAITPLTIERAKNASLWCTDGRQYIDFAGGIAVLATGHLHERVTAAVQQQLTRLSHSCFMVAGYDVYVELCEKMNALVPGDFDKRTALFVSGSEAVENAVKVARAATKRPAVIAFTGGYHGRTWMTMALNGKVLPYSNNMGLVSTEWIFRAQFPCALHGVSVDDSLASIERVFRNDVSASDVAAIILEPVQGEGGFYDAPKEFMQRLRALCDEHGILLIADEVQTGVGRTGKFFAMEHFGVSADITTFAKSIGGGLPISGITGREDVMSAVAPGGLGGTYGGPPLACAAALAVIETFEKENLLVRANEIGEQLRRRLRAIAEKHACIADVRGLGAMVAFELFVDNGKPDAATTAAVIKSARENGLVLLSCGVYGNVVRLLPPFTISNEQLNEGLDVIEKVFGELAGRKN